MKPLQYLPDDYKLMTVLDLNKSKKAKRTIIIVGTIFSFIMGSFFFLHLFTIFLYTLDGTDTSVYTLILWEFGLIISPILIIAINFLLIHQMYRHFTGEKSHIIINKIDIYFFRANYYFTRKQTLEILLFPQTTMILFISIMIPFVSTVWVSLFLYSLAIISATNMVNSLIASYVWQLPENVLIRQNQSLIEIYRHKKLDTLKTSGFTIKKDELLDTAVFPNPTPKENTTIDENKLKEKEIAKFTLDNEK